VAELPESFNFGNVDDLTNERLLVILQRMYVDLATAINQKPDLVERDTDGQTTDTFLANGTININSSTNKVEILTNHPTQATVTWVQLS